MIELKFPKNPYVSVEEYETYGLFGQWDSRYGEFIELEATARYMMSFEKGFKLEKLGGLEAGGYKKPDPTNPDEYVLPEYIQDIWKVGICALMQAMGSGSLPYNELKQTFVLKNGPINNEQSAFTYESMWDQFPKLTQVAIQSAQLDILISQPDLKVAIDPDKYVKIVNLITTNIKNQNPTFNENGVMLDNQDDINAWLLELINNIIVGKVDTSKISVSNALVEMLFPDPVGELNKQALANKQFTNTIKTLLDLAGGTSEVVFQQKKDQPQLISPNRREKIDINRPANIDKYDVSLPDSKFRAQEEIVNKLSMFVFKIVYQPNGGDGVGKVIFNNDTQGYDFYTYDINTTPDNEERTDTLVFVNGFGSETTTKRNLVNELYDKHFTNSGNVKFVFNKTLQAVGDIFQWDLNNTSQDADWIINSADFQIISFGNSSLELEDLLKRVDLLENKVQNAEYDIDRLFTGLYGEILLYPHYRKLVQYDQTKNDFFILGLDLNKYKYIRFIVAQGDDYSFGRQNGEQIITIANHYGNARGGWLTATHRQGSNTFLRYNILLYDNKITFDSFEHTNFTLPMYLKLVIGYE